MNQNFMAFLTMLSHSEGTDRATDIAGQSVDPYRTTFQGELSPGVRKPMYVTRDLTWHPAEFRPDGSNEWIGESIEFLGSRYAGMISTAAGRYQITRPTWMRIKNLLGLPDFTGPSQDEAAIELIKEQGALNLVNSGQVALAINACHPIWASLPGSTSGQPTTPFAALMTAYGNAGGGFA